MAGKIHLTANFEMFAVHLWKCSGHL